MDEELGAKAPVTRLRRRLSVESDDSTNSPSAPSTPTKKRGGRLAAKPQLELIDEVNENVPKKTPRKSIARDIEPAEDKVITPSRRSARIRSNTSLLADTPKVAESPRAKRAARRNSQLGSDNDTPVAPVRQTRRTRKDSTASIDVAENENEPPITNQTRKSPETTDAGTKETADVTTSNDQFINCVTTRAIDDTSDTQPVSNINTTVTEQKDTGTPSPRISPRLQNQNKNKTPLQRKGRKSTKSINNSTASEDTQPSEAVNNVTPDKNDLIKSNKALSVNVTKLSTDDFSGASVIKEGDITNRESETLKPTLFLQKMNGNKEDALNKSVQKENSQSVPANANIEDKNRDLNMSFDSTSKVDTISHGNEFKKSDAEILLGKAPGVHIQSVVVIEDSDSNCGSGKLIMDIDDDQCVPVVENQFVNTTKKSEIEPMDIDESIPNNITIDDYNETRNVSKEEAAVPHTNTEANINRFLSQSSILSIPISKDVESSINRDQSEIVNTQTKKPANESQNVHKNLQSKELDSEGEKIKSLNNSTNKTRRSASISLPLNIESDILSNASQSNKSKRKSSISAHSDSNSNLNQSNKSMYDSPSNKDILNLNASSNVSQLNYSLQLDDDDSKKMSSSICSADKEEKSVDNSKRKSSLSDANNSKLLQFPKDSNNASSKNKSRNSNQHSMAAESNDITLDNIQNRQEPTENAQTSRTNLEESSANDTDKNKSSVTIAQADSQNLEKSTNENKSTLILPQLRDMLNSVSINDTSRSNLTSDVAKNTVQNITENYSTSTPLQQKSMQKLVMQINTSIISPSVTNKSVDKKPVKNVSAVSSDNSDSSDEELEATKDKSKMIDDEASEASDDYESGDSRDDEERKYEEENEIREKGETLESVQDFSNDSDYEKDSFVVSSDEEDNEMLSGTGDDLSLSDRELTMSKKSKKKYDERKRKEQKKASKEMYEARHNINKSNEKSKPNKKSKPRFESSDSESDDEAQKPKMKNRRRIDSSHEVSVDKSDTDESIGLKKKKVKRLSESVCENSTVNEKSHAEESLTHKNKKAKPFSKSLREETADANEKEITIWNESAINNKDPLVEAVKIEPETPQKDFNMSTVPILDNMEEVQVDANMTVLNSNETSDPLQATMAQDEDSLSSENTEIIQNYDSVLNNLNNQKKIKNLDRSLNINNKSNAKVKEPIIDQLNLTQTKPKKNKDVKKNKENGVTKVVKYKSESSDSIDMELLFSEDSNDSETNSNKINQSKKNEIEPAQEYIPLKKTPAKTHIPVKIDTSPSLNNSGLNNSKSNKKKKSSLLVDETENTNTSPSLNNSGLNNSKSKKKSSLLIDETESTSEQIDDGIKMFIDTTGTLELDAESTNMSASKKKKKKHLDKSGSNDSIVENDDTQHVTDTSPSLNNSGLNNSKSNKKKKSFLLVDETENTNTSPSLNNSGLNNSKSKKKSSLLIDETESTSEQIDDGIKMFIDTTGTLELDAESTNMSASKKKKKKHLDKSGSNDSIVENDDTQHVTANNIEMEPPLEVLFKSDKKKKKNKSFDQSSITYTDTDSNEMNNQNVSINLIDFNETDNKGAPETPKSEKKKKNKNMDVPIVEQSSSDDATNSAKKKDKKSKQNITGSPVENTELNTSQKSEKKKKKNKNIEDTATQNDDVEDIGVMFEDAVSNLSLDSSTKSEKKKKKPSKGSIVESNDTEIPSAKKKAKKLSETSINTDNLVTDTNDSEPTLSESLSNSGKKKKNKHNLSVIEPASNDVAEVNPEVSFKSEKKKKNKGNTSETEELDTVAQTEDNVIENTSLTTNKKKNKSIDEKTEINVDNIEVTENLIKDVQVKETQTETVFISEDGTAKNKKKKKKRDNNEQIFEQITTKNTNIHGDLDDDSNDAPEEVMFKYEKATPEEIDEQKSKKRKLESECVHDAIPVAASKKKKRKLGKTEEVIKQYNSKKRKRPDGGVEEKPRKVFKEHSSDNIHVPRLPTSVLDKLKDQPKLTKKTNAIATSNFIVEDAKPRKNKPSTYLEQSVYLNDTPKKDKKKHKNKEIPIVLPFLPTAATSDQGYTSKFKINVVPKETQFLAEANVENFRNNLLSAQRIKKMGTFEKFKSQRSRKLCKF